jgi:hypothetical protein
MLSPARATPIMARAAIKMNFIVAVVGRRETGLVFHDEEKSVLICFGKSWSLGAERFGFEKRTEEGYLCSSLRYFQSFVLNTGEGKWYSSPQQDRTIAILRTFPVVAGPPQLGSSRERHLSICRKGTLSQGCSE